MNIFRFLKEKRFDFNLAYADLLSTIQWRIETKLDQLDYNACSEFFEEGFAFFHGTDNSEDHPLLFVRLRYFPRQFREPEKSLSEQLLPFSCYLLEIARKYTWDLTRKRLTEGHSSPLVWKVKVVVNVAKAPLLPVVISSLSCIYIYIYMFIKQKHVGWSNYQNFGSRIRSTISRLYKFNSCLKLWLDVSRHMVCLEILT